MTEAQSSEPARSAEEPPSSSYDLPARISQRREQRFGEGRSWEDLALAWRLHEQLPDERVTAAVDALVARHESFRTTLAVPDGTVVQRVASPPAGARSLLRLEREADTAEELSRALAPLRRGRIDLGAPGTARWVLCRSPSGARHLVLLIPHAFLDAWSGRTLERELTTLLSGGELGPPPLQVGDVAAWEERIARARRATGRLPSDSPPRLPLPRIGRDRELDFDPALAHGRLAATTVRAHAELARTGRATEPISLLATLFVLLAAETGMTRIAVGLQDANRDREELAGVVGSLIALSLIVVEIDLDRSFRVVLERVAAAVRQRRADPVPIEAQIAADRDPLARAPFAEVVFNRVPADADASSATNGAAATVERVRLVDSSIRHRTRATPWGCQATLNILPAGDGGATLLGMFNTLAFDAGQRHETVGRYDRLAARVADDPERALRALVEPSCWLVENAVSSRKPHNGQIRSNS